MEPGKGSHFGIMAGTGDISAVCRSCGLCCNGALNFAGDLRPDEVSAARRCGLDVCETSAVPVFRLPCPQYRGLRCAVYAEPGRPQACRGYRCWVLQRYLDGRLTERNAQRVIGLAIALHTVVAARIGAQKATAIIRLAKTTATLKAGRVADESGTARRRFAYHLGDVQGAHDEPGCVSAELIQSILRAGGFLRRHFVSPESARKSTVRTQIRRTSVP
jgi:uncharacterized protein